MTAVRKDGRIYCLNPSIEMVAGLAHLLASRAKSSAVGIV
jgi:hypothetical protein